MQLRAFFAKSNFIEGCQFEVWSRLPATQILLICLLFTALGTIFYETLAGISKK